MMQPRQTLSNLSQESPQGSRSTVGIKLEKELLAENKMEERTKFYHSFSAVKNKNSYLIITQKGTILLFEDGEEIYRGSSNRYPSSQAEQAVYVRGGDFYLLRFENQIYKKRIDDKDPSLLLKIELDQTGFCSFRRLRWGPNRLLIKAKNDRFILFNAKTSKVEARFKMARGLYSVVDFHSHNKVQGESEESSRGVEVEESSRISSQEPARRLVTILCLTGRIRTFDICRRQALKTSNHSCRGLLRDEEIDLSSFSAIAFSLSPKNRYICLNLVAQSGLTSSSFVVILEREDDDSFTPLRYIKIRKCDGFHRIGCFGYFPDLQRLYFFGLRAYHKRGRLVRNKRTSQALSVFGLDLEGDHLEQKYDLGINSVDQSIFDGYLIRGWFYYTCDSGNVWRARLVHDSD